MKMKMVMVARARVCAKKKRLLRIPLFIKLPASGTMMGLMLLPGQPPRRP